MINRKSIFGAIVGLLLLTGIVGANLVMAGERDNKVPSVQNHVAATAGDNLGCPDQGLPACEGQMTDEKSDGPENEANEQDEKAEGSDNEANNLNENDTHEDAQLADHQCPPDCDTANGEMP